VSIWRYLSHTFFPDEGEKQVEKGLVCFFFFIIQLQLLPRYLLTTAKNRDEKREQVTAAMAARQKKRNDNDIAITIERTTKKRDHPRKPDPVSRERFMERVNRNRTIRASRAVYRRLSSLLLTAFQLIRYSRIPNLRLAKPQSA
jgi:RNase P protein component